MSLMIDCTSCGRGFIPSAPNQDECISCLIKPSKVEKMMDVRAGAVRRANHNLSNGIQSKIKVKAKPKPQHKPIVKNKSGRKRVTKTVMAVDFSQKIDHQHTINQILNMARNLGTSCRGIKVTFEFKVVNR